MKHVVVTSYVQPDLDGVASAIAYAEYLRATGGIAIAESVGQPQEEATYMLSRVGVQVPPIIAHADASDAVILVDASDLNDLEGTIAPEQVVQIIDHRAVNEAAQFPNANTQIEMVGAAATLIAEKYIQSGTSISQSSAALLYGAIISNTLNFQGSMTTDRDRQAAAWLNAIAQLPADFWKELFSAKSDVTGGKLARRIEDDFSWFVIGGKRIGIAELELTGAQKLLDERVDEIVATLARMKESLRLDVVFMNLIELDPAASFVIASDANTKQLLARAFDTSFVGPVAQLGVVHMRKQLAPLLKNVFAE